MQCLKSQTFSNSCAQNRHDLLAKIVGEVDGTKYGELCCYKHWALVTAFTYLELPFEVDKTSWQVLVRVIWDASCGYAPEKLNGGKPGSHGNQILIDKCTKRDSLFVKMQNDPNSFPGIVYLSDVIVCRNFTHIAII